MLKLINLSKFYFGLPVINPLNLEIASGEFIYIIGKSGAGKSTLLKLLSAEIPPSEGAILFNNENITTFSGRDRRLYYQQIGRVYQDFKLIDDCTVFENLAYPLEVRGLQPDDIQEKVSSALDSVGLSQYPKVFPTELSGGEQQRLGIARAMITEPSLLIADEPTANLDFQTATKIMDVLESINQRGTTIIMATHNPEIIDYAPHRLLELSQGKIIRDEIKGAYHSVSQGGYRR